jgi:hypothetical protein
MVMPIAAKPTICQRLQKWLLHRFLERANTSATPWRASRFPCWSCTAQTMCAWSCAIQRNWFGARAPPRKPSSWSRARTTKCCRTDGRSQSPSFRILSSGWQTGARMFGGSKNIRNVPFSVNIRTLGFQAHDHGILLCEGCTYDIVVDHDLCT